MNLIRKRATFVVPSVGVGVVSVGVGVGVMLYDGVGGGWWGYNLGVRRRRAGWPTLYVCKQVP